MAFAGSMFSRQCQDTKIERFVMRYANLGAVCVSAAAVLAVLNAPCRADDVAKFYEGKQIALIVGSAAGGGYDAYARLVAQFMRAHVPGRPLIVVQNMPGGAGVTSAGYMYNVARKDGTFIAVNPPDYLLSELWRPDQIHFDSRRFGWLGTASTVTDVLGVFRSTGVRTIEDAKTKPLTIGATAPIATNSLQPALANALLGTKFRVVKGYTGGSDPLTLAMERREIDGRANSWASWKLLRPQWIAEDQLSFLVQFGPKDPDIPGNVPSMADLATTPKEKSFVAMLDVTQHTGRAFFTTPDVPNERLEALRKAFDDTMADPAFVEQMRKLSFDLRPQKAPEVHRRIEQALRERDGLMPELKKLLNLN
jgi:tripartite-type tricarboxylate transporter receptor subunit TctC